MIKYREMHQDPLWEESGRYSDEIQKNKTSKDFLFKLKKKTPQFHCHHPCECTGNEFSLGGHPRSAEEPRSIGVNALINQGSAASSTPCRCGCADEQRDGTTPLTRNPPSQAWKNLFLHLTLFITHLLARATERRRLSATCCAPEGRGLEGSGGSRRVRRLTVKQRLEVLSRRRLAA